MRLATRSICRRFALGLAILAMLVLLGCSDAEPAADEFCTSLAEATGPDGAEVNSIPGEPAQLDALVDELKELHERAPDEIATTTRTLADFFDEYRQAPREERRSLLVDNEQALATASAELDAYAVNTCGLFLQRTPPTPAAVVDPGVEVAPE